MKTQRILLASISSLLCLGFAHAAIYYWDTNGSGAAGFGTASGAWGASTFWGTDAAGSGATANTTITTADGVNFGTATAGLAAGTVTGPATAQGFLSMTFGSASGAIVVSGGTLNLNTTGSTITVNNSSATISTVLQGIGTLIKSGAGTLTLSGNNGSLTGNIIVNGGTLSSNVSNGFGSSSTTRTITINNGATVEYLLAGMYGGHDTVTVPTFIVNAGGTLLGGGQNQLNDITLNGGTLTSSSNGNGIYRQWNINGTVTSTGNSTISSGTGTGGSIGITLASGARTNTNFDVQSGTLSVTALVADGVDAGSPRATSLTKIGNGTLALSGANIYSGATTVSAGTLRFIDRAPNSSASLSVASGATLEFNVSTAPNAGDGANVALGVNGGTTVTGNGSFIKSGAGVLALDGQGGNHLVTFNMTGGLIDIQGGTLRNGGWDGGRWISNRASMNIASGAIFDIWGGESVVVDALTGGGTINASLYGGSQTLTVGANNGSGTFSGVFQNTTGSLGLIKTGGGTQTLTGANTYSGMTTLAGGVLNVATLSDYGVAGGLGNRSADGSDVGILFQGGTLQYTGATAQSTNRAIRISTVGGATIDASGSVPSATLSFTATSSPNFFENPGGRTLTLTGSNTGNNTFAMAIQEAGGPTSVIKNGTGKWVLTGANTYTGATTVNGGTLKLQGGSTPLLTDNFTATGNPNTLDLNYNLANRQTGTAATQSWTATDNAQVGNPTVVGQPAGTNGDYLRLAFGGQAKLGSLGLSTGNVPGPLKINFDMFKGTTTSGDPTEWTSFSLRASGDGFPIGGPGEFGFLYQNNTGIQIFNNGGAIDNIGSTAGGDSFGFYLADSAGTGSPFAGNGTRVIVTQGGSVLGSYALNASMATSLIAFGSSGGMIGGVDNLGVNNFKTNGLDPATAVSLTASGATLELDAVNQTVASLSGVSGSSVKLGPFSQLKVNGTASATFGGVISGTFGSLIKTGTGTQTLSGANTYTGVTTVSGGTLALQNTYASSGFAIASGNTLELNVASGQLDLATAIFSGAGGILKKTGAGIVIWQQGAATFALGSGSMIDVQGGTFVGGSFANENWTANLSGLNVAAGATFNGVEANVRVDALTGAGTILSGYPGAGYSNFTFGVNNGSGTFSGVLANGVATGNFVKEGSGTQTLTGTNTYTGATNINGGVLAFSSGGTISAANTINVNNSGTLRFDRNDTFGNDGTTTSPTINVNSGGTLASGGNFTTIWGLNLNSGTVALTGGVNASFPAFQFAGTLTATGTSNINVVSGSFNIINIGGNGNGALNMNVVNSLDVLNVNAPLQNNAFGAGSLTKSGLGNLILTAANTYTGPTAVSGGTLAVSGSISGTSSLSLTAGALLLTGSAGSGAASNRINDAASVTLNGGGLKVDNTFTSAFNETFGALTLSSASTLDFGASPTTAVHLTFDFGSTAFAGHYTGGATLNIANWTGTENVRGGEDQLLFTNLTSVPDQSFLNAITFSGHGPGAAAIAFGTNSYEIVAVPEPSSTVLIGAALLGLVGFRERRRLLGARRVHSGDK